MINSLFTAYSALASDTWLAVPNSNTPLRQRAIAVQVDHLDNDMWADHAAFYELIFASIQEPRGVV